MALLQCRQFSKSNTVPPLQATQASLRTCWTPCTCDFRAGAGRTPLTNLEFLRPHCHDFNLSEECLCRSRRPCKRAVMENKSTPAKEVLQMSSENLTVLLYQGAVRSSHLCTSTPGRSMGKHQHPSQGFVSCCGGLDVGH